MLEFYVVGGWLLFLLVFNTTIILLNWKDIKNFTIPYGMVMILVAGFITFGIGAEYLMSNIKTYSDAFDGIPKIEKIKD